MKTLLVGLLLALPAASIAAEVTDNFESGTNPNLWRWQNNEGGGAIIEMAGGNPGAWLYSGPQYFSDHPNLSTVPPSGSPLAAALASGTLHSASLALNRMPPGNCFPNYTASAVASLELFDQHSDPDGFLIEAHTTNGPRSTGLLRFSLWQHLVFPIPSDSTDPVPDGWELNNAPDGYTWHDLMQNIDGISFFVLPPDQFSFDRCWRLGADNITVTYGDTEPEHTWTDRGKR